MAKKSIEELRAQFKKDDNQGSNRPNNYYPFWNMKDGEQATVRFLPDQDDENSMGFMVEKLTHVLDINGNKKTIPCLKMYGDDCPICKVSAAFYKDEDKINGKRYWRKKQHVVQALIISDPLPDNDAGESHEGKVRYLSLGYQLFNIIKASFESGELDEIPYAYEGGCNFIIKKTMQGEYPSYVVGTNFARKATDLTEDQIALAQDDMVELGTLLPQHPGLEAVEGMLEASLTGGTYDEANDTDNNSKTDFTKVASKKAPPAEKTENAEKVEVNEEADDATSDEADDILAKIRSRKGS